jgi:hypothetical protein
LVRVAPFVQPLVEAIEELLTLLEDSKQSAEAQKKLDALAAKVAELEAKLASQADDKAEIARLRTLLKQLGRELQGPAYATCGAYKYRNKNGICVDARAAK